MLTYLSNWMLGAASRAGALRLDAEARIVMADHWWLAWRGPQCGGRGDAGEFASSLG